MIPHSVLPALARWFGLTPPVLARMSGVEVWTFVSALPDSKGR